MWWFKIIIYFVSILTPGLLLVRLLRRDQPRLTVFNVCLAYGLGSSFIALILFFYFFIFRLSYSSLLFWLTWLLTGCLTALVMISKNTGQVNNTQIKKTRLTRIQLAAAIIILVFSAVNLSFLFSHAAVRPAALYDSLAMWSFKAKVLFYEQKINFDPAQEFYLGGGGHLNYPWQIPLVQYWLHANLGVYDDLAANWIFVGYFLSLIGLVFFGLKRYISFWRAFVLAFFLFSMPLVFYHGFNAYADLPLAFYLTGALTFFYAWLKDNKREDLILAAIFWGLSFWVKDGAWIIYLAFLLVFFVYCLKRRLPGSSLFKFILISLAIASPWLLFRVFYHLSLSNVSSGLVFKAEILISVLEAMFVSYSWNLWWFFLLIAIFFNFKRIAGSSALIFIWSFLGLGLLSLILVYLLTMNYQYVLDQTALSRTLLSLIGVSVLAVGFSFNESSSDY